MNSAETKNLIIAAKNGDAKAFSELYELYFVPVYRYIYFRVKQKEEAEDLTQAVFMKVYSAVSRYEDVGKPPLAYFYSIARNAVIDYWRRHKRVVILETAQLEQVGDRATNLEADMAARRDVEMVLQGLKKLTEEQAEIITLKFINDLSTREIAELLGKSEDAVRQIQHRALEKLRVIL